MGGGLCGSSVMLEGKGNSVSKSFLTDSSGTQTDEGGLDETKLYQTESTSELSKEAQPLMHGNKDALQRGSSSLRGAGLEGAHVFLRRPTCQIIRLLQIAMKIPRQGIH